METTSNEDPGRPIAAPPASRLTVKEYADRIGVHPWTVYRWIREGAIPVSRYGPSGRVIRIEE